MTDTTATGTETSTGTSAGAQGRGSAKEEILRRIRTALADIPDLPPEQDVPVAWEYGRPTRSDGVLDLFVERVEDYKAQVIRCRTREVPGRISEALRSHGARSVVLPAGLEPRWREAVHTGGFEIREDEPHLDRAHLDATDAVVTACCVGAAESGTIMLDHRPDQGRRALTLVPDLHVCVIRADQVVSDVPEAVARLAPSVREERLPLTWISGGSATSDIELSRVEGVHGPRTLVVLLVDDEDPDTAPVMVDVDTHASHDEATSERTRRVSSEQEVTDGGYGPGSAAPLPDHAMPLGHPVPAWTSTEVYAETQDGVDAVEPDVWFTDAEAARRAGFVARE